MSERSSLVYQEEPEPVIAQEENLVVCTEQFRLRFRRLRDEFLLPPEAQSAHRNNGTDLRGLSTPAHVPKSRYPGRSWNLTLYFRHPLRSKTTIFTAR